MATSNRFKFPDGARFEMATAFTTAKPITSITNAKPPVATSPAHGLQAGGLILLTSGWNRLNSRGARVANPDAETFELEGFNTMSLKRFPEGAGAGSFVQPTDWVWIDKILEAATSGGEQQFWTGGFLEDDDDTQVPTTRSPQQMALTLGDDPDSARDQALLDVDGTREEQFLRLVLPSGDFILYTGYVSYNDNPVVTRANPMSTRMTLSLTSRPVRYKAAA